jgi:hypothetical protein
MDESAWAKLDVRYEILPAAPGFLRMNVTGLEAGRAQLVHPLPSAEGIYRLDLQYRATSGLPVAVGVRQRTEPYRFLWQASLPAAATWQTRTFTFSLPAERAAVGLYLNVEGVGHLDIKSVKMIQTSPEEYRQSLASKATSGRKNLLPVSRFPLGLQGASMLEMEDQNTSGSVDREVSAKPDPKLTGPSGTPALKVEAPQRFKLRLNPVAIVAEGTPHTASLYVRGEIQGKLNALISGGEVASTPFSVSESEGWKRIHLTFPTELLKPTCVIELVGERGSLWVDAAQVEAGEKPTPYQSQYPVELAFSDGGDGTNVFFADAPAKVSYALTGPLSPAILKLRVVNLYGDTKELRSIKVDGARKSGTVAFDVFPNRPLGVFRIEGQLESTDGKALSAVNEIVVNRLRRPKYWMQDAPNSPFGTHLEPTTLNIRRMKAIGVNWARLHDASRSLLGWAFVEPEKGRWTWHDAEIERFRKNRMQILGTLSTTPPWASYFTSPNEGYWDEWFQPRDLSQFANYVSQVVGRYRGKIDTYEIWNEPWFSSFFSVGFDPKAPGADRTSRLRYLQSPHPQKDYAAMTSAAASAARGANPNVRILGLNTTTHAATSDGMMAGSEWTAGLLAEGGLKDADILSYHDYLSADTAFPGDEVEEGYKRAFGPIERSGLPPKPVWMTEGQSTLGLPKANGFYKNLLPFANDASIGSVSDRLCRYVVSLLGRRVSKVFLYSTHTRDAFGREVDWLTLVNADGTLHPAAVAHSQMAFELEDKRFDRRAEVAPNVFAYVFTDGKASVAVIARKPGTTSAYALPTGADLDRRDLYGNVLRPLKQVGQTLVYVSGSMTPEALITRLTSKAITK